MAITNHERVGKAMELLKSGLQPFVEREMKAQHEQLWLIRAKESMSDIQSNMFGTEKAPKWDAASLLSVMQSQWHVVFKKTLGAAERTLVMELRDARNKWAHQQPFSTDDAYRVLDSVGRLLMSVSAKESVEVERMKNELLRVRYDEQVRSEKRKSAGVPIETQTSVGLKPWREVVTPHKDVASGRYQQAEFAADLWQVHIGEGSDEYKKPDEFFRRTYLTESLKQLLIGGVRRLTGVGGDPVVQLQTNFGGGKTHSMLALYHLFSGARASDLPGIDEVMKEAGVEILSSARRVVLVGNKISPGNPTKKSDGTVVRTLWGELAWQLGFAAGGEKEARKAYSRVKADDEKATSPGDVLRELMNDYGPCLILVDEWVAYARQLHDQSVLPAGTFETHFTFAQALTESAKLAKKCLLVISLPASDTTGSPHAVADDVEVGGERGRTALARLRNSVGRVEASWRPASAEEGFEIVRRRLFEPLVTQEQFVARDTTARAFFDFYSTQRQEFPPECHNGDYEKRIKAAYPIHPEIFDRLYTDWSTLVKFQRTRGVLRLMASVIHSLWEKGDKNPLILPANISIDDPRVQFELTRYLSDNWVPVIEKDVDGPAALPLQLDRDLPNLGKYSACRRVARTIYLGSAPTVTAAHRGIEDRRVKLGCVMPGESVAIFGDALRRLATAATYLYQDGARYWYSTQPTVTKLAEDRAEQLQRDLDAVPKEVERRLRNDLWKVGDFSRIHPLPQSSADVPDETDARLVVLGISHPYSKDAGNFAEKEARTILSTRGNSPRLYQNTLVFLAVDKSRLQDLDQAARKYLAWQSIIHDKESLDLSPYQVKQAENQLDSANQVVDARLPEAYQWLLVPGQKDPQSAIEWQALRLSGTDALAARASKKLRNDESLVPALAGSLLRMHLDRVPLWRGENVSVRQLCEDFARYLYLPRLKNSQVLLEAIRQGIALLTWQQDSFAIAESYDDNGKRYRGLQSGIQTGFLDSNSNALIVRSDVAKGQIETETSQAGGQVPEGTPGGVGGTQDEVVGDAPQPPDAKVKPRRYHGSVVLDPDRVGRDAGRVAEEVVVHLASLPGAKVRVVLEIQATMPAGAPEQVVRTVTENGRSLKFQDQGFEEQ
ncbi:MAG: Swt1 family HEPN domain-containing protein [Bacteroidota bacterium]